MKYLSNFSSTTVGFIFFSLFIDDKYFMATIYFLYCVFYLFLIMVKEL